MAQLLGQLGVSLTWGSKPPPLSCTASGTGTATGSPAAWSLSCAFESGFVPAASASRIASPEAFTSKVLGWPRRCKLAHALLWEHSYKRLQLAQLLGRHGVFLTCAVVAFVMSWDFQAKPSLK